jgi:hypothetical protein
VEPLFDGAHGQHVADHQYTLAAETRHYRGEISHLDLYLRGEEIVVNLLRVLFAVLPLA